MTTKTKKKNNSDSITAAMMSCGGKVSGKKSKKNKKQKLADGGNVVWDYNALSDTDKAEFDKLSIEDQNKVIAEYMAKNNNDPQNTTSSSSSQFGSSMGGSSTTTGQISGIIGAVTGIAESAGGEENEYGGHGSDVETYLSRSSDIGGNIQTGIDDIKEGEIVQGIGNILQLGGALNASEDQEVEEAKKAVEEAKVKTAYYQKRNSEKFADGGQVDEDPTMGAAKEIYDYINISSGKYSSDNPNKLTSKNVSVDSKSPNKEIVPPEGYEKVPLGTNPETGDYITNIKKKDPSMTADMGKINWKDQTNTNVKHILHHSYGKSFDEIKEILNSEDADQQIKNILKNEKILENDVYPSDYQYQIIYDKEGNWKFQLGQQQKLAEGGEIEGAGTGKSDSINAELPVGSYILPADAPEYITERLKKYLNYDEAELKQSNGKKVKVSDGELLIMPEDVQKADEYVRRLGFENGLDEVAPNAEHKLSERPGYADGGQIEDYAGYLGGAAQIMLGMFESSENERPESNTEELLRNLSNEVRMRAEYGLNPYERTQAELAIERSFNNERELINKVSGGDVAVYMNNAAAAANREASARLNMEVQSSKLKDDKLKYADEITMKAIMAHEQEFNRKYDEYMAKEEMSANLIDAGISNVIGQSQKNQYEDMLNKEKQKDRNMWAGLFSNVSNNQNDENNQNDQNNLVKSTKKEESPIERIVSSEAYWMNNSETIEPIQ